MGMHERWRRTLFGKKNKQKKLCKSGQFSITRVWSRILWLFPSRINRFCNFKKFAKPCYESLWIFFLYLELFNHNKLSKICKKLKVTENPKVLLHHDISPSLPPSFPSSYQIVEILKFRSFIWHTGQRIKRYKGKPEERHELWTGQWERCWREYLSSIPSKWRKKSSNSLFVKRAELSLNLPLFTLYKQYDQWRASTIQESSVPRQEPPKLKTLKLCGKAFVGDGSYHHP